MQGHNNYPIDKIIAAAAETAEYQRQQKQKNPNSTSDDAEREQDKGFPTTVKKQDQEPER